MQFFFSRKLYFLVQVNLVTDDLPTKALSLNPPDLDIMDTPPRVATVANEILITPWLFLQVLRRKCL